MDKFNNISDCINFIESQHRDKPKKDLHNMQALCNLFDNPQDSFKIVHVAGTNGKGSIVSYLSHILNDAKYKVATFTSPYIECFNERIEVNNQFIADEDVIKYANIIIDKYPLMDVNNIDRPSFFAFITLMCFLYFKDANVDIAIIEAGIGGLLDDTNIVNPILTIISNVGYDHMNVLGNTIEEIALNKLGIVKKNVPLVTIQHDEIYPLIRDVCYKNYSLFTIVYKHNIQNVYTNLSRTRFNYLEYSDIELKMLGKYQTENAAIAIEAVRYLHNCGFIISKENVYQGLLNTQWVGRLEVLSKKPLIIVDGAHNSSGFERLMEFMRSIKGGHHIRLVLAISANKDKNKMLGMLDETVDEVIFTSFSYKRSDLAQNLFSISEHKNKLLIEDCDEILARINKDNCINIFSGSLYFVSEIRKKIL